MLLYWVAVFTKVNGYLDEKELDGSHQRKIDLLFLFERGLCICIQTQEIHVSYI